MDSKSKRELEECVLRILKHGDPNKLTESKVRKLAADETGCDPTEPVNRKLVKRVVEDFFLNRQDGGPHDEKKAQTKVASRKPPAKQPAPKPERRRKLITVEDDEEEEAEPETNTRSSEMRDSDDEDEQKPTKKGRVSSSNPGRNQSTQKASDSEEFDQSDSSEASEMEDQRSRSRSKKRPDRKLFPDGDIPVCELSKTRFVAVQSFNGKTLVAIREYYEKDGKLLPGRKGISLTVEQWEAVKEGIPDIDGAIRQMKR